MGNPGWRGRVEDYRWAANEAAALGRTEFTRAEILDLANQIAPLYAPGGAVPAEYAVYQTEQARLLEAVEELRRPLPSEEIAPSKTGCLPGRRLLYFSGSIAGQGDEMRAAFMSTQKVVGTYPEDMTLRANAQPWNFGACRRR